MKFRFEKTKQNCAMIKRIIDEVYQFIILKSCPVNVLSVSQKKLVVFIFRYLVKKGNIFSDFEF